MLAYNIAGLVKNEELLEFAALTMRPLCQGTDVMVDQDVGYITDYITMIRVLVS
jgi:hypothetical protein